MKSVQSKKFFKGCPTCGGGRVRVVSTYRTKALGLVRLYRCRECNTGWRTVERRLVKAEND